MSSLFSFTTHRITTHLYIALRQMARSLIIHNTLLDHFVGDHLRRLEKKFRIIDIVNLRGIQQVQCHGFTLMLRQEDVKGLAALLFYGDYEPETTRIIKEILNPGECFVDLGAHIGYFSLLAAQQVGEQGKVYAFEPIKATFEVLQHNIRFNKYTNRIVAVNKAVTDASTRLTFLLNTESSVSNKIVSPDDLETEKTIEIDAVCLDDFFSSIAWPKVHLIKMDVEGSEMAVLKGMQELNQRNPHLSIIFEFHEKNLERMKIDGLGIFDTLKSYGFTQFYILHRDCIPLYIPDDMAKLDALSHRFNVNILATKSRLNNQT